MGVCFVNRFKVRRTYHMLWPRQARFWRIHAGASGQRLSQVRRTSSAYFHPLSACSRSWRLLILPGSANSGNNSPQPLDNLAMMCKNSFIVKKILNDKIIMTNQTNSSTANISDVFTITDIGTLKAVSTPFRQNLMRLMADRPRTVKDMAEDLGMPPSRLYYHLNQLFEHEIIRVAKTQIVSGIVEKHYQLSARMFRVDRSLLAPGSDLEAASIEAVLASTLDATEKEIRQGVEAGVIDMRKKAPEPGATFIGHAIVSLSPEHYSDFLQRLYDLYLEFEKIASAPDQEDAQLTGLLVAFYPTIPPAPQKAKD